MLDTVNFTAMADGTYEEYQMLEGKFRTLYERLPETVLAQLQKLGGDKMGYKVDRLEHSLQTATRAYRDSADEETVVVALLHDIGDNLCPMNHADFAAAVMKPFISKENLWMLQHHPVFQGYYYYHHVGLDRNARDRYRGHPQFEMTAAFCERWDQASFDPAYDTMPLSAFEPMVGRLFARKPYFYGE
jgi:predicted HD phosphohydrolase